MINYLQLNASSLSEMIDIASHYLFTCYIHIMRRLLVSFANSLDPDLARQCIEAWSGTKLFDNLLESCKMERNSLQATLNKIIRYTES